ncbi:hypothetical protein GTR04_7420 [Trichophyton interdigitale]|nr:hypothetical protein GY631_7428 [Trichophyton interdigitale]KAG5216639.1 hypothetical protein GY632_7355 [Trichophyton interdigitale]KAG8205200.1 hypothetical protein GTR04_7420 [Trichophyton interdigitale]
MLEAKLDGNGKTDETSERKDVRGGKMSVSALREKLVVDPVSAGQHVKRQAGKNSSTLWLKKNGEKNKQVETR